MKRLMFIPILVMGLLLGCKQDYTCTCTLEDPYGDPRLNSYLLEDVTRSQAEDMCRYRVNFDGDSFPCVLN